MPDPQAIPSVPNNITVHLGSPQSDAPNVVVPFIDYIKNVASSEIYPTWDEDALVSNILAQISFALNRVYTEFYRSQGKNFQITNSTAIDQKFIYGRNVFSSVDRIVDDIFNNYIRRKGFLEPLAAKFCNGTTVTCSGLSQWGSEKLAQEGLSYLDILYRYYGRDIEIVVNAPIQDKTQSYPGTPVKFGDRGANVQKVQVMLNRISLNYPSIPKVNPVDGIFGNNTLNAVKTFQRIFNLTQDGIVGKATWYRLVNLYVGITKLSELNSEGQRLFGFDLQYPDAISFGDRGEKVLILQYFLKLFSQYTQFIPPVEIDGIFGPDTLNAVKAYQQFAGLPVSGIVDRRTWDFMFNSFRGIVIADIANQNLITISNQPFRTELMLGSTGKEVVELQRMINLMWIVYGVPDPVPSNGVYDKATENAVKVIQAEASLPVTGIVDRATWNSIIERYNNAVSTITTHPQQYPGVELENGTRDTQAGVK